MEKKKIDMIFTDEVKKYSKRKNISNYFRSLSVIFTHLLFIGIISTFFTFLIFCFWSSYFRVNPYDILSGKNGVTACYVLVIFFLAFFLIGAVTFKPYGKVKYLSGKAGNDEMLMIPRSLFNEIFEKETYKPFDTSLIGIKYNPENESDDLFNHCRAYADEEELLYNVEKLTEYIFGDKKHIDFYVDESSKKIFPKNGYSDVLIKELSLMDFYYLKFIGHYFRISNGQDGASVERKNSYHEGYVPTIQ